MSEGRLLKVGVIGAVVVAICCFTPALAVLLGALGLSHLLGVLDYVLLPALLIFVGLIFCGLIRKSRAVAKRAESQ
jgi:mercuric ion transport protein